MRVLLRVSSSIKPDSFFSFSAICAFIWRIYSWFYSLSASPESSICSSSALSWLSFSRFLIAVFSLSCVFLLSSYLSSPILRHMASYCLFLSFSARIFSSSLRFSSSMFLIFLPKPSLLAPDFLRSFSNYCLKPSISFLLSSLFLAKS